MNLKNSLGWVVLSAWLALWAYVPEVQAWIKDVIEQAQKSVDTHVITSAELLPCEEGEVGCNVRKYTPVYVMYVFHTETGEDVWVIVTSLYDPKVMVNYQKLKYKRKNGTYLYLLSTNDTSNIPGTDQFTTVKLIQDTPDVAQQ